MKRRTDDGRKFTKIDDGVTTHQTVEYTNPETAEAEFLEDWGSDGRSPEFADWRMLAEDLIAEAQSRRDLPKGAKEACGDVRYYLVYQRQIEAGQWTDRQDLYRYGVALGMALERLRVWLDSTAVKRGRKVQKGAQDGHEAVHGTREEKEARWAGFRALYDTIKARNPYLLHSDLVRLTAKQAGVSEATIKRHCKRK